MAKKVLLIDYEPRSVDRVRSLLAEPEYELTVAKDGEEGISVFSASTFDTILLAGMLPRLPSAEVIREIRRRGGATAPPILLMVSGYHGSNPKARNASGPSTSSLGPTRTTISGRPCGPRSIRRTCPRARCGFRPQSSAGETRP